MSKTYRVAIAGSDRSALNVLRDLLIRLGHCVVAEADSLESLFQSSVANGLELIICDLEPERSFDALNESVARLHDVPVIIASNNLDAAHLESNVAHQVFGVLLKPLREVELAVMIVVAAQRFHEFSQLRDEAFTLRAALEDRKVIERAKGVIMKKCGLDEANAFSHLQHLARQHRQKIIDVAKGILIAETAFVPIQIDPKASLGTMPSNTSA
jgi:AmiR/NasT family two-component response regulator